MQPLNDDEMKLVSNPNDFEPISEALKRKED
jgi:hypothetical protein